MDIPLGNIVSSSQLQKDYKKVFNKAKKTKQPVIVMRGNTPEVTIVDAKLYESQQKRLEELEIEEILRAATVANKEYKAGKLKILNLGDLAKIAGFKEDEA